VADGTHFETFEDNLLAEHHIRYGKTGGIAYRHIADNYIALFGRFIACGTYEATYILDALLLNLSDLHPKKVHADTHGQSDGFFGLAYLLGIELMPRIRRWRKLKLYRADPTQRYSCIQALFSGTVNWELIREHYAQFMQLSVAIQSGSLAPSAVLARINSYSTRNRFAQALQEQGKAVRTKFLLEWIRDEAMRRTVHKCTTKIERHHRFVKFLVFGNDGQLQTNDPADQEKWYGRLPLRSEVIGELKNEVDPPGRRHQSAQGGRCSVFTGNRRVQDESYRGWSGYRKTDFSAALGRAGNGGDCGAAAEAGEVFGAFCQSFKLCDRHGSVRRIAALGAIAAEAWSRGQVVERADGQAVCVREQERCGGCARDLDGRAATRDQSGGDQERGAASSVGSASDA
jgi:TnpA family transposase